MAYQCWVLSTGTVGEGRGRGWGHLIVLDGSSLQGESSHGAHCRLSRHPQKPNLFQLGHSNHSIRAS